MGYQIAINKFALTEKLPKGDQRWEAFNTSFENRTLDLIDIANEIYLGHAYTAWHNGRRCTENFLSAQFVAVDMDTKDERSSIDYLAKMEFVRVYGGMIYSTPSHTDAEPRSRVIFLLDQPIETASAYKTAIDFIYSLFPGADGNCIKASGFFYGSHNCRVELIDNVLPIMHMRSYYKRWAKTNPQVAQVAQPTTKPAQTVTQPRRTETTGAVSEEQRIAEALKRLDPWSIDYKKWVAILGALHDEFGDTGLTIAEDWADGAPGEIKRMWASFGRFQGKRAGLGTIMQLAKVH